MSDALKITETLGQNPDPAQFLQDLDILDTDKKKFNYLRTLFIEEADVDNYIQYLDTLTTDDAINLIEEQAGVLEGFKRYLKEVYLPQTGERIQRFDRKLEENVEAFANPDITPEEVDKIAHTRRKIAQVMQIANAPRGVKGKSLREATGKALETAADVYKSQYEKMDAYSKSRCSWKELVGRLLADGGKYLSLAEGLNEHGVLFGVDLDGNPLFADGGEEPIMTGMNYVDTRNRVFYKYDGENIKKEGEKPVRTGYEMFPCCVGAAGSEIRMFEAVTGKPFVKSLNGKGWRSSWLESGEMPPWPWYAYFRSKHGDVVVRNAGPQKPDARRGVRRLLRVRKS
jgi:hypothetical protein